MLIFIPYWVNYVIRTYAWMPLLGRTGVINYILLQLGLIHHPIDALLYNTFSVQLVLVYVFPAVGIVPLYLSLERLDDNVLRASADPWRQPGRHLAPRHPAAVGTRTGGQHDDGVSCCRSAPTSRRAWSADRTG